MVWSVLECWLSSNLPTQYSSRCFPILFPRPRVCDGFIVCVGGGSRVSPALAEVQLTICAQLIGKKLAKTRVNFSQTFHRERLSTGVFTPDEKCKLSDAEESQRNNRLFNYWYPMVQFPLQCTKQSRKKGRLIRSKVHSVHLTCRIFSECLTRISCMFHGCLRNSQGVANESENILRIKIPS